MATPFYEILELNIEATSDEIKKAYRNQARKWHPDRNTDNKEEAEARFKAINEAYEILSNEAARKAYCDAIKNNYPENEAQERAVDIANRERRHQDNQRHAEAEEEVAREENARRKQADEARRQEYERRKQAEQAQRRQSTFRQERTQTQQPSPQQNQERAQSRPTPTPSAPKVNVTERPSPKPNKSTEPSYPFYGSFAAGPTHFQNASATYTVQEFDFASILLIAIMLEMRRRQQILAMLMQTPIFYMNINQHHFQAESIHVYSVRIG